MVVTLASGDPASRPFQRSNVTTHHEALEPSQPLLVRAKRPPRRVVVVVVVVVVVRSASGRRRRAAMRAAAAEEQAGAVQQLDGAPQLERVELGEPRLAMTCRVRIGRH